MARVASFPWKMMPLCRPAPGSPTPKWKALASIRFQVMVMLGNSHSTWSVSGTSAMLVVAKRPPAAAMAVGWPGSNAQNGRSMMCGPSSCSQLLT
jgi:hypothetical protein